MCAHHHHLLITSQLIHINQFIICHFPPATASPPQNLNDVVTHRDGVIVHFIPYLIIDAGIIVNLIPLATRDPAIIQLIQRNCQHVLKWMQE